MAIPTWPMVHFDEEIFSKWYARFGAKLTMLMDMIVVREWMNTHGFSHIYITFNGDPEYFPDGAVLSPICLRKSAEAPTLLQKFLGETEEKPHGRLIVIGAKSTAA